MTRGSKQANKQAFARERERERDYVMLAEHETLCTSSILFFLLSPRIIMTSLNSILSRVSLYLGSHLLSLTTLFFILDEPALTLPNFPEIKRYRSS